MVHVKRAQSAWRRSCPVAGVDGLCVVHTRQRADRVPARTGGLPTQCGPAGLALKAVARKPGLVTEALASFRAASAFAEKSQSKDPSVLHFANVARLAIAESTSKPRSRSRHPPM